MMSYPSASAILLGEMAADLIGCHPRGDIRGKPLCEVRREWRRIRASVRWEQHQSAISRRECAGVGRLTEAAEILPGQAAHGVA